MSSVAVAMCTYNGERFLAEQLDSLEAQSRKPDLLVAVDDCSTDRSFAIVEEFAARSGFPVVTSRNETNSGCRSNFERAVRLADCDLVYLCDQDDVWMPTKIEEMSASFSSGADLVFCDATVVDDELTPLGYSLWDSIGFTEKEKHNVERGRCFDVFMRRNLSWGATMAFRKSALGELASFPEGLGHDTWLFLALSATGSVSMIRKELNLYRQHTGAVCGAQSVKTAPQQVMAALQQRQTYCLGLLACCIAMRAALANLDGVPASRLAVLDDRIRHLKTRAQLPNTRILRIAPILYELMALRYCRFSRGLLSAGSDLLRP